MTSAMIRGKKSNNVPGEEDEPLAVKYFTCLYVLCSVYVRYQSIIAFSAMCATEFRAYFCRCSQIKNNKYGGFWMRVCFCAFFSSVR